MIAAVKNHPRRTRWLLWLGAAIVLVPCLIGFGYKFAELIKTYQGNAEGAFAITPMVNYLCASTGFLLLFGWALRNGMFRDMERPKYNMLEQERALDRHDPAARASEAILGRPGHNRLPSTPDPFF